jgi:hypothetical protein
MEVDIHYFEFPLNTNYSKFLFYSSFMIGISSGIVYYMKERILTLILFLLFLTSINFWRKPEYGLRRNIDIFLCWFVISYFITVEFLFLPEFNRVMCFSTGISILVFHIIEHILCSFKSLKWIIFHILMHIYASFFPVIIISVFLENQWKKRGFEIKKDFINTFTNYIDTMIEKIELKLINIYKLFLTCI